MPGWYASRWLDEATAVDFKVDNHAMDVSVLGSGLRKNGQTTAGSVGPDR
ncbi:hypothetical protein BSP239C_01337 [Brevibacterium sp. 239c]|nr:hypothetical protein BSP239C_01337 [Brevibacterium sp. 239c]